MVANHDFFVIVFVEAGIGPAFDDRPAEFRQRRHAGVGSLPVALQTACHHMIETLLAVAKPLPQDARLFDPERGKLIIVGTAE